MNWYVKYDSTGEISGPMTKRDALSKAEVTDVLVFNDEFFEGISKALIGTTLNAFVAAQGDKFQSLEIKENVLVGHYKVK